MATNKHMILLPPHSYLKFIEALSGIEITSLINLLSGTLWTLRTLKVSLGAVSKFKFENSILHSEAKCSPVKYTAQALVQVCDS